MNAKPRTATFLFTDLENSTPLWENHHELMQDLAARHDVLLQQAVAAHRGRVVKSTGDGFHAIFESAADGAAAALAGQQALITESWPQETGPLKVRMGLHSGESRERDGDYYGPEVNRAARVMSIAYGGQILISGTAAALMRSAPLEGVTLLDLGEHRLRGLSRTSQIFQLCHPDLPRDFPPIKTLSLYKHNLPVQLSTFVGRQQELADIKMLLPKTRLLTLLGPGGTGKTRLMLEAAEEVIDAFSDGVWFVELATLTDPTLIAERIAAVLNVQLQPGHRMEEELADYLRHKELLLLIDNVEHLIRESAELAEYLLSRCPQLKILVTGREALFIGGEITLQIPSLSLPAKDENADLTDLRAAEGIQLFVARAQDVRPDFDLKPENAAAVAEIVRRLDGIPLALELAAARLRMLTVEQIAERLNDRFRLLTGGRRTALPRQQTLQALIDWSWNLLDEKERLLLQRLSVFSGGWSLEAAQAVAADERLDEYDVFDNLEQLVNKSLVIVTYPAAGEARYGLLESIRQYGRDRLFESDEAEALRDRHAAYFVSFAEEAGPHLAQSTMLPWVEKIRLELDNLRTVMTWTLEERPELALRTAGALLYLEVNWLPLREVLAWLEPAVEATRPLLDNEESGVRIRDFLQASLGLALAYGWQGNHEAMRQHAVESIQLARSHDLPRYLVVGLTNKHIDFAFNMMGEAMQDFEEAIAVGRELKLGRELVLALLLYSFGLFFQGEVDADGPIFEEIKIMVRKINNPGLNTYGLRPLCCYGQF